MFKTIHSLALFLTIQILSSCSLQIKDKKDSQAPEPNLTQKNTELKSSNLTLLPLKGEFFEIIPGSELNQYSLSLNHPSPNLQFQIRELFGSKLLTQKNHKAVFQVTAGGAYEINYDEQGLRKSFLVSVPQDKVFSGRELLGSENDKILVTQYRRIHFKSDALVVIEGKDLILAAEEISSANGAKLVTFDERIPNSSHSVGKPAGRITIEALKSSGQLTILADGQIGGTGLPGAAYTEAAKQGKNGGSTLFSRDVADCSSLIPGQAGENGLPGKTGAKGFQGGQGGRILIVRHTNHCTMELNYSVSGGLGGLGGSGGLGQSGGAPGINEFGSYAQGRFGCSRLPEAATGQNGPQGPNGTEGIKGLSGLVCVSASVLGEIQINCLKESSGILSF